MSKNITTSYLLQAQAKSAKPAAMQERSGSGGSRRTGPRAAGRPAAFGPRHRQRRRRRSLRGSAGSRGVALTAAQPPAGGPRPGADDRGTKSRGPTASPPTITRTTAATCTQGNETAAAASSRLSRLPRSQVDTARPGQAVAGGPGRLPDAARSPSQVAGGPPVDHRHRSIVRQPPISPGWRQQPALAAKREQSLARQSPAAGHAERPDHEPAASLASRTIRAHGDLSRRVFVVSGSRRRPGR